MNLRLRTRALSLWICAGLLLPAVSGGSRVLRHDQTDTLTLDQARAYMIELINRDRASRDLPPVHLDPVATTAAQQHADEMASYRYMAHWDRAGRPPDQRYTEAGGRDHVMENVYLSVRSVAGDSVDAEKLPIEAAPTFTRREIEEIEAAYFNEVPPHDGHRRNILAEDHTGVGVALTRAQAGGLRTLANAQEFVDHYLDLAPLPATARVGDEVSIQGKLLGDARLYSVSLARSPLPAPMDRDQLQRTRQYAIPKAFTTVWPEATEPGMSLRAPADGSVEGRLRLNDAGRAGLYYVQVWVRAHGRVILAAQQTVVVR